MLHEYALDPQAISTWQTFRYFVDRFGVHHGRMIARFPKRWERMVYDTTLGRGEIERKRIEEGLIQIKAKLLRQSRSYDSELSWLENAETQHRTHPFHAIIACSNASCTAAVLIADEVCETTELWNIPSQIHAPRIAEEMARRVQPFLAASSEVLFVDPHFNPDELRFRRSLEHFVEQTIAANRQLTRIEYHLKYDDNKPSSEYFANQCKNKLPSLIAAGIELRLIRWKQRTDGREIHARYILTEIGGISFDPGLDEGEIGELVQLTLLEPSIYKQVWTDYQHTPSSNELVTTYEYYDEVVITGTKR